MKRISFWSVLFISTVLYAQPSRLDSLFHAAAAYYKSGQYAEAEKIYNEILKNNYHAPELYYNLGNTAYKQNRLTDAVYYFEKALQLNPGFKAADENLKFVRRGLHTPRESLPELFYKRWWRVFVRSVKPDTWSYLSLVFLYLAVILFVVFLFSKKTRFKKISFYSLPAVLVLWLFFLFSAYSAHRLKHLSYAVITDKQVGLYEAPSLDAESDEKAMAGEKVQILSEDDFWAKIKLSDGKTYWIIKEHYRKL
jgi:tetratricopeptide (TPR) repeat protein